jgi:hypothetical protein
MRVVSLEESSSSCSSSSLVKTAPRSGQLCLLHELLRAHVSGAQARTGQVGGRGRNRLISLLDHTVRSSQHFVPPRLALCRSGVRPAGSMPIGYNEARGLLLALLDAAPAFASISTTPSIFEPIERSISAPLRNSPMVGRLDTSSSSARSCRVFCVGTASRQARRQLGEGGASEVAGGGRSALTSSSSTSILMNLTLVYSPCCASSSSFGNSTLCHSQPARVRPRGRRRRPIAAGRVEQHAPIRTCRGHTTMRRSPRTSACSTRHHGAARTSISGGTCV